MTIILKLSTKFDKSNKTPLHYAARFNRKEIGELLISKGANVNVKAINYQKMTLLSLINRI